MAKRRQDSTVHENDQSSRRKAKGKRVPVPRHKRRILADCEPGDLVRLETGELFMVTARFNGGPGGRMVDSEGVEGELMPVSGALRMTLVNLTGT